VPAMVLLQQSVAGADNAGRLTNRRHSFESPQRSFVEIVIAGMEVGRTKLFAQLAQDGPEKKTQ